MGETIHDAVFAPKSSRFIQDSLRFHEESTDNSGILNRWLGERTTCVHKDIGRSVHGLQADRSGLAAPPGDTVSDGETTKRARQMGAERRRGKTMAEETPGRSDNIIEPKALFRADVDQSGDWYVWRRLGASGWATLRRCCDREQALELAKALNLEKPIIAS
jgi:hypothetical protein